jgi:xanthine dehydrogenase FAD-binding subunit
MYSFESYEKAASTIDAIRLLTINPDAKLIAGGTEVLISLHNGKKGLEHIVDIHDVTELQNISLSDNGNLNIGAGATFTQIMNAKIIKKHLPVLSEAVGTVGGPQVRNVATIGGNICNGVTCADSAPILFALNAVINIEGPAGKKSTPISDFYLGPGKVALEQSEVMTSITISPDNYQGYSGHYRKYAMRNAMDIATIGCAVSCKVNEGKLEDIRIAYGVAGPVPMRCPSAEGKAMNQTIDEGLFRIIANSVLDDVNPRTSWRASKDFRLQIIKELALRVTKKAIERAGGVIK